MYILFFCSSLTAFFCVKQIFLACHFNSCLLLTVFKINFLSGALGKCITTCSSLMTILVQHNNMVPLELNFFLPHLCCYCQVYYIYIWYIYPAVQNYNYCFIQSLVKGNSGRENNTCLYSLFVYPIFIISSALHFFLWIQVTIWHHFLFSLKIFL